MSREFQLYIVSTPIGNIKDITYRAIEVLKTVDLIACEDTRVTQKLLNHYEICTKCVSYHKYNEKERVSFLLQELQNGTKIALVSDAGTPMICDPGCVLINELVKNNITFTSIPGACAVTTFLSQISRANEEFAFVGFIPRTQKQIEEVVLKHAKTNVIFYDSPERILKTLEVIKNIRGDVKITLGRELTKLFEEIKTGTITEVLEYFKDGIKGEIVCMVYANKLNDDESYGDKIKILINKGYKAKDVSIILSSLFDTNKNEIYKKCLEYKK